METTKDRIIVAFHIGRGGRFNNAGHKSFIGEKKIGDFTNDLYSSFENLSNFKNRFGYDNTGNFNQKCILDLVTDENFEELEEVFGIKKEELGEEIYYDGGGNSTGLTQKEVDGGIGKINIDYDYNTTYTMFLDECDKDELLLIADSNEWNKQELIQKYFEYYDYKVDWSKFNEDYEGIITDELDFRKVDFEEYVKEEEV